MDKLNFVIILIIILVVIYILDKKENFDSENSDSANSEQSGKLFNYFYQSFMNPYSLPLNKFFSNDIQSKN